MAFEIDIPKEKLDQAVWFQRGKEEGYLAGIADAVKVADQYKVSADNAGSEKKDAFAKGVSAGIASAMESLISDIRQLADGGAE